MVLFAEGSASLRALQYDFSSFQGSVLPFAFAPDDVPVISRLKWVNTSSAGTVYAGVKLLDNPAVWYKKHSQGSKLFSPKLKPHQFVLLYEIKKH